MNVNGELLFYGLLPALRPAQPEVHHSLHPEAQAVYPSACTQAPRDPGEVLKREDAVVKSLVVAPSSNALFIEIAPMGKKK